MLENLDQHRPPPKCKIKRIRDDMDDADQKRLDDAMEDQISWSDYHLFKALVAVGVKVSESTVKRHRQKTCSCWKI
jgi:hypothetical protein